MKLGFCMLICNKTRRNQIVEHLKSLCPNEHMVLFVAQIAHLIGNMFPIPYCLFGTKPLFEPLATYCKLDHWQQIM